MCIFFPPENRQPKNRDEEKDMLQKLNVRLACYIERLRELEKENDSIRKDVSTIEFIFFISSSV